MRAPSLIITALVGVMVNVSMPAAHAATVTFVTLPGVPGFLFADANARDVKSSARVISIQGSRERSAAMSKKLVAH